MNPSRDRLRIAVQKSGRLSEASLDLLRRAGLSFRASRDKLFLYGENLPVDVLLVRDDDIRGLLLEGSCELGMVGRNVLDEQRLTGAGAASPQVCTALGFGQCRLAIAVPAELPWDGPASLAGRRIATSYPGLLGQWLREHGIEAEVVVLNGSVEIAPRLGKAEAVCDLVSTGATLAANQLREVETVLESIAVLAQSPRPLPPALAGIGDSLVARIRGVLGGDGARLLMLRAPRAALAEIARLLPAREAPSVLRLDDAPDQVALQALCGRSLDWQHLEALKRLGAHGLMVLNVEQVLA
ncbi:MAG: ATP phosphoribosyltransferase [Xanthomonadales bacterium]|nr:ATP phosphoribosyltransferase [Xanthomonadales bacterium]